jgi:TonB-linked SusC/RagA family outer membrane protein
VTGKVTSSLDGSGVPGASILIKGTSLGTTTDADGKFSINSQNPSSDILVVSFIGFATQEVAIQNRTVIDIVLAEDVTALNEVVVTALGIEKETKSLTYAVQSVKGEELAQTREANFINGLAGKVAGVQVNRSSSGVGGSTRVVLRGAKSTRENQALYVVDGVPLSNYSPAQPGDVWGGRDGGDGISNINPEDIESVNVLKGASAAALYGSAGANGAIVITTKKGKAGQSKVTFSSNLTFEKPMKTPDLQYKYGQTNKPANEPGSPYSWGSAVNAPDHVDSFFNTGSTWVNSVSVGGGTDKTSTFLSYSNTDSKGMMPTNTFKRHQFGLNVTSKLFNDKLVLDGTIKFTNQKVHNRPVPGLYNAVLPGLYLFPRGLDFNSYKNNFEYYSPLRNMMLQNWWNINYDNEVSTANGAWAGRDDQQNPYWILNRYNVDETRNRVFATTSLKYFLKSWLTIQLRGNVDKTWDHYDFKANGGTQTVVAPRNGRYNYQKTELTQFYGDVLISANKQLNENFDLSAALGASVQDSKMDDLNIDTRTGGDGLNYANAFQIANILPNDEIVVQTGTRRQLQALFMTATLGHKDRLFFDVTARNDWSSTFAFTPTKGKGYFYYSAGVTSVFSQMFTMPDVISFLKGRISYAAVGNDVSAYSTNPWANKTNTTRDGSIPNRRGQYPGSYLKPEDNRSFEVGTEIRFFNDRVGLDVTYYVNDNLDQYTEVPGTLGSIFYLNLGHIRNKGVEVSLNLNPIKTDVVNWTTTFNVTANKNEVVKIGDQQFGAEQFPLSDFGVNMYGSFLEKGGQWGDLYANRELKKDEDGNIVVNADGDPITQTPDGGKVKIGSINPKMMIGWNNTVAFKNGVSVSFLIDGRFGGKVVSVTQSMADLFGVSKATQDARDNGGVFLPAVNEDGTSYNQPINAEAYYSTIGGRAGVAGEYVYDATNIRLREFSVGYRLPLKIKGIQNINLSVIGRNLFFFSIDAPFDPEVAMSTGNNLQGVDVFGLPSARSIGFSLNVGL